MALSLRSMLRQLSNSGQGYVAALLTGYGLMGLTIIVQLALIPLYLTHLGKERFGVLIIIMATNSYAAIAIAWLSGSMARILAERAAVNDIAGFREAYAFSKIVYVTYAFILVTLFWIAALFLMPTALADWEIRAAVVLSCVYFLLAYEYNTDRQAFIARHLQACGNLREAAGQVVFAIGVGLGLFLDLGLPSVIGAQIAGIVCTRMLAWRYWRKDSYKLGWLPSISGRRELWGRVSGRVGRDYALYGAIVLTLQADALLIGWFAGPELAATYYLLWRIPEVCILILWRIPGTFSPHFIAMDARNERETLQRSYRAGLRAMLMLAGLVALAYGLAGSWILELWVGEYAIAGKMPYMIAGAALFFIALSKWPAEIAYALMNTRRLVAIAAFEVASKLLLFWALFTSFGYLSPLIAIVLVHVCAVSWLYIHIGKSTASNKFQ